MAKTYIPGETKEQRKARKRADASQKFAKNVEKYKTSEPKNNTGIDPDQKRYVLCLKHGNKYGPEYVNTLKRMVDRKLSLPYEFVCLTENPKGIDSDVKIIDLPKELSGWWCKPYMYSKDLPIKGDILYMDLDVVISGNLNKLFEYSQGDWCVIRDFTRAMQPSWQKYNSSVIRFKTGQLDHVWKDFIKNPSAVIGSHFGDQDWLWTKAQGTAKLWPDEWIRSWKWEIRKDRNLKAGQKGTRTFVKDEHNARPSEECCITVFHGDPNPHNCADKWVVNNWR